MSKGSEADTVPQPWGLPAMGGQTRGLEITTLSPEQLKVLSLALEKDWKGGQNSRVAMK